MGETDDYPTIFDVNKNDFVAVADNKKDRIVQKILELTPDTPIIMRGDGLIFIKKVLNAAEKNAIKDESSKVV